jgi:hypothetical protein
LPQPFEIILIDGEEIVTTLFAAFDQFTFSQKFNMVRTGWLRQPCQCFHITTTQGTFPEYFLYNGQSIRVCYGLHRFFVKFIFVLHRFRQRNCFLFNPSKEIHVNLATAHEY